MALSNVEQITPSLIEPTLALCAQVFSADWRVAEDQAFCSISLRLAISVLAGAVCLTHNGPFLESLALERPNDTCIHLGSMRSTWRSEHKQTPRCFSASQVQTILRPSAA